MEKTKYETMRKEALLARLEEQDRELEELYRNKRRTVWRLQLEDVAAVGQDCGHVKNPAEASGAVPLKGELLRAAGESLLSRFEVPSWTESISEGWWNLEQEEREVLAAYLQAENAFLIEGQKKEVL